MRVMVNNYKREEAKNREEEDSGIESMVMWSTKALDAEERDVST